MKILKWIARKLATTIIAGICLVVMLLIVVGFSTPQSSFLGFFIGVVTILCWVGVDMLLMDLMV